MLHIVTPLSRPQNIPQMLRSVKHQIKHTSADYPFTWHIVIDAAVTENEKNYIATQLLFADFAIIHHSPHNKALAGHAHRNVFLDWLATHVKMRGSSSVNWVYFLDDDTVMHPAFMPVVSSYLFKEIIEHSFIIFNQWLNEHTPRLNADSNNLKVGHIDTGMFMYNFESQPEARWLEDDYCADGHFATESVKYLGHENVLKIDQTLSYYNYLRPE